MSQSRVPAYSSTVVHQMFDAAKRQFREPEQEAEVLNLLAGVMTMQDEIQSFLMDEEAFLITTLFGEDCLPLWKELPENYKPWSRSETDVYYEARYFDTKEISEIHVTRGNLHVMQNPYTNLDKYQLLREKNRPELTVARNAVRHKLKSLHLLAKAQALLADKTRTELAEQHYFYGFLVSALRVLWARLKVTNASVRQNKDKPEAVEQVIIARQQQSKLVAQVDAVNEFMALAFVTRIRHGKIDQYPHFYKEILSKLAVMKIEIFPWLAIHYQKVILQHPGEESQLVQAFFNFHTVIHHYDRAEALAVIFDAPYKENLYQGILAEKITLNNLRESDIKISLKRIAKYTLEHTLSDWVCYHVCKDIMAISTQLHKDDKAAYTFYKFIQRVRQDRFYLIDANQFLDNLQKTINPDISLEFMDINPVLYATIVSDTPASTFTKAQSFGVLTPDAKQFYASVEFEPRTGEILLAMSKDRLREYLTALFMDYEFLAHHKAFLLSSQAQALEVRIDDFPVIAMHLHYSGLRSIANIEKLWEEALAQELFAQTDFFKCKDNIVMFERLNELYAHFAPLQRCLPERERYRELLMALSVYRTVTADIKHIFLAGVTPVFKQESDWSNIFYWRILQAIATPDNSIPMDFERIVRFLDIKFDKPASLPVVVSQRQISEDIKKISNVYFQQHPDNSDYLFKIINNFILLYKTNKYPIDMTKSATFESFKLPPVLFAYLDTANLDIRFLSPVFETPLRKQEFFQCLQQQAAADNMNTMLNILRSAGNSRQTRLDENHEPKALLINFGMELFYAYCKVNNDQLQSDAEKRDEYLNFMLFYEIPDKFLKHDYELVHTITNHLLENRKSESIFVRKSNETLDLQDRHLKSTTELLSAAYSNLTNVDLLSRLINDLSEDIQHNTFNRFLLSVDPYHTFVVALCESLKALRQWQGRHLSHVEPSSILVERPMLGLSNHGMWGSMESKNDSAHPNETVVLTGSSMLKRQ